MAFAQVFLIITVSVLLTAVTYGNCKYVECGKGYEPGPDDCYQDGLFYPIYAKWASIKPGECLEYQCNSGQRIFWKPCKPEDPSVLNCYPVNVTWNYYPYCCPKHKCVEEKQP